jgi:hypothetical protein
VQGSAGDRNDVCSHVAILYAKNQESKGPVQW